MTRHLKQQIVVNTEAGFKTEWQVINQNVFLQSLKKQIQRLCPLAGASLGGDMVSVEGEDCSFLATLQNLSTTQTLHLKNFRMIINPDYSSFVQLEEATGEDLGSISVGPTESYTY